MTKQIARSKIEKKINNYKITKETKKQIFDFLDNCNEFMIGNLDDNFEKFIIQSYQIQSHNSQINSIMIETKQWVNELMLEIYASKKNMTTSYIELYLQRWKINSNYKKK